MKPICSEPDCDQPAHAVTGLCTRCYQRAYQRKLHGRPGRVNGRNQKREGTCSEEGCEEAVFGRGRCSAHYYRLYRQERRGAPQRRGAKPLHKGAPASQACCVAKPHCRGLCGLCYERWRRTGYRPVEREESQDA